MNPLPPAGKTNLDQLTQNSSFYREFEAERTEIVRHKWLLSEKEGVDIGFERALFDWVIRHRTAWRLGRAQRPQTA